MDFYQAFRNRKTFSIRVTGESMYPLFRSGDLVRFRQISFDRIRVNDIVLVRRRRWFAHRVVYKGAGFVLTQGDNNPYPDGIVKPHQTVGRAESVTRDGRQYRLQDIYTLQTIRYQAETAKLQRSLQEEGIPFVFLKGLPLYQHYFKSIPRRLLADCDILVGAVDCAKADRVFRENGYTKERGGYDRSFRDFAGEPQTETGFAKYVDGFPVIFDVHYEAAAKNTHFRSLNVALRQMTGEMLSHRRTVTVDKAAVPLLSLNDQILFLLLHLANHLWGGFFRYDFLYGLLEKGGVNWSEILTAAKEVGLINYCYPALHFLAEFYGMKEPLRLCRAAFPDNCRYSQRIVELFFRSTVAEYNIFRLPFPSRVNKFVLRFLLYDRPFLSKATELLRENFLGYLVRLLIIRIRRSRGSSGTGQQTAGLQASKHPAS